MPRKMRNPKTRIQTEITEFERQWFLGEGWGQFINPAPERRKELWAEYSNELTQEYQKLNPELTADELREWITEHQQTAPADPATIQ